MDHAVGPCSSRALTLALQKFDGCGLFAGNLLESPGVSIQKNRFIWLGDVSEPEDSLLGKVSCANHLISQPLKNVKIASGFQTKYQPRHTLLLVCS